MSSLLGGTIPYVCENCRTSFSFELWSVVDTEERPDLLAKIMDGSIRRFPCPSCGTTAESIDPLLVYRPREGGVRGLIFASSTPYDNDHLQSEGGALAHWLANETGADPQEIGIVPTTWALLPAFMERNLQQDLETPDAQLDLAPELGSTYRDILRQLRVDHGLSWVTDLGDADLPEIELGEQLTVTCPACHDASAVKVPRIVTDRPGLAGQLRGGDFYTKVCPKCGEPLPIGFAFLVWRPRRNPKILAGVIRGMSPDGVEDTWTILMERLQTELGSKFREEWFSTMVALPHDDLADRLEQPT